LKAEPLNVIWITKLHHLAVSTSNSVDRVVIRNTGQSSLPPHIERRILTLENVRLSPGGYLCGSLRWPWLLRRFGR
jgi:hypothetical protein